MSLALPFLSSGFLGVTLLSSALPKVFAVLPENAQKTADGASQIALKAVESLSTSLGSVEQELLGEVIKREHWLSTQPCKDMDIENDSPCQELRDFLPNFRVDPINLRDAQEVVDDLSEEISLLVEFSDNCEQVLREGKTPTHHVLDSEKARRFSDLRNKHLVHTDPLLEGHDPNPLFQKPRIQNKVRELTEPEKNYYKRTISDAAGTISLCRRELHLAESILDSLRAEDAIWRAFSEKLTREYYLEPGEKRLLAIQFEAWRQSIVFLMPDAWSQFKINDEDLSDRFYAFAHQGFESATDPFVDLLYRDWWLPLFNNWQLAQKKIQEENWPHQKLYQAWRLSVGGKCSGEARSSAIHMGTLGDVFRFEALRDFAKRTSPSRACLPRRTQSERCTKDLPEDNWGNYYEQTQFEIIKSIPSKETFQELGGGVPSVETIYQWARLDYEKAKELFLQIHSYATDEEIKKYYQETDQRDIFRFDPGWLFITNRDPYTCLPFKETYPTADRLFNGMYTKNQLINIPLHFASADSFVLAPVFLRRIFPQRKFYRVDEFLGKFYNIDDLLETPLKNGWRDRFELWKNPPPPPSPPPEKPLHEDKPPPYNLAQVPEVFQRTCEKLCELGLDVFGRRRLMWHKAEDYARAALGGSDPARFLTEKEIQSTVNYIIDAAVEYNWYIKASPDLPPCDCAPDSATYGREHPLISYEEAQHLPPYNLAQIPEVFQRSCQMLSSMGKETTDYYRKLMWSQSKDSVEHFLYPKRIAGLEQVLTPEELERAVNRAVFFGTGGDYYDNIRNLPSDCTLDRLPGFSKTKEVPEGPKETSSSTAFIGLGLTTGVAVVAVGELARRRFTNTSIKALFTKAASTIAATIRATKRRFQNTPITAAAIVTVESGAAITTLLANEAITITVESGAELLNQQLDAEHLNLESVNILPAE